MKSEPSIKYLKLRVAVQERGSSIRKWALGQDPKLPVGLVYNAARGERKGPEAKRILKKLEEYAYAQ
ncbi:MAG TPA: hypothetical protein VG347_00800 [Verrucomicrobiae bacterium]|nr:hypothetical protein [Verrucomicrobiae bacterium]